MPTELIFPAGLLALGLVTLVYGADMMVQYASQMASHFKVSPLLVGLTILAFGSSAPELAVSLTSTAQGESGVAVGNVIGSCIANLWLILGVSALVFPLRVHRQLLRFDVPVMAVSSILLMLFSLNGQISRNEGFVLCGGLVAYLAVLIWKERRARALGKHDPMIEEMLQSAETADDEVDIPESEVKKKLWRKAGLTLLGLCLLILGSDWMVSGSVQLARFFGVDEVFIGLTIVAIGTSLPELATTFVAALRKETDMAIGNVVGSNIFNIFVVLGLTASITPLPIQPQTIALDIPTALLASLVCLPMLSVGMQKLGRFTGLGLLTAYISYLTNLVLQSQFPEWYPRYEIVFFQMILPAILVLIVGEKWWEIRIKRQKALQSHVSPPNG